MAKTVWFCSILFLLWVGLPLQAQDRFYVQLLEEGKQRMIAEDYEGAASVLEIAAFGFLDYPDKLFEAYACQVVAFSELGDQESVDRLKIKIRVTFREDREKPDGLPNELWLRYRRIVHPEELPTELRLPTDIPSLNLFLAENPDDAFAWSRLIELSLAVDRWGRVKKNINRALDAFPDHPEILRQALIAAHRHGQNRQADRFATKLIERDALDSLAHEYLGNRAADRSDWGRADEHFKLVTRPVFAETERNKARVLRELAARGARRSVEPEETDGSTADRDAANDRRAASLDAQEARQDLSRRQLESIVKKNPNDLTARCHLVAHYLDRERLKKAKRHLQVIGRQDPGNARYLELFGQYCFRGGLHQANVDQLFPREDRTPESNLYLGLSLIELGRFEEAAALLKPLSRDAYPQLSVADQKIQAALGTDPSVRNAANQTRTRDRLRALVASDQATYSQQAQYIDILISQGDWQAAKPLIRTLNKDHPKEPVSQYYLARQLMEENDYQQAAQIFSNLTNAGYHDKETFYFGGLAYYYLGKKEFANYLFSRALRSGTDFESHIMDIRDDLAAEKEAADHRQALHRKLDAKILALRKTPPDSLTVDHQIALLRLLHERDREAEFKTLYRELRSQSLDREDGDLVLAWRMVSRSEYEKALRLIERIDHAEATYLRGYVYYLTGQTRLGEQVLADLRAQSERFPELNYLFQLGHL